MKLDVRHWPQGILAACMAAAAAVAFWPAAAPVTSGSTPPQEYKGPLFQLRRTGPDSDFPFRSTLVVSTQAPPAGSAPPALVGIVGVAGYLRSSVSGEVERLVPGATLDGWTVKSVGSRHILVTGPGGDVRLELFASSPPSAPAPTDGVANPAAPEPAPSLATGG